MSCELVTAIIGILSGYLVAVLTRRFSHIDTFGALILEEIKSASTQSDNINGEFCISKWHFSSKRRVRAYRMMFDWDMVHNGRMIRNACLDYEEKEVGLRYKREDILDSLACIYKETKK